MSPTLSVVIPAYNEERRLPPTLGKIAGYFAGRGFQGEILIVDDGSSDGTVAAAAEAAANLSGDSLAIRALENPGNRGKGYSVRRGMLAAECEWVLFTDADLSSPIEEASKLFEAVERDSSDIAVGSRALDRSLIGATQPLFRQFSGRFFNFCVRMGTGLPIRDTQCGFKLFSRRAAQEVFRRQRMERFGFDVEILYIARRLGYRISETPVVWNDVLESKVTLLGGADAFLDIARVRLNAARGLYR